MKSKEYFRQRIKVETIVSAWFMHSLTVNQKSLAAYIKESSEKTVLSYYVIKNKVAQRDIIKHQSTDEGRLHAMKMLDWKPAPETFYWKINPVSGIESPEPQPSEINRRDIPSRHLTETRANAEISESPEEFTTRQTKTETRLTAVYLYQLLDVENQTVKMEYELTASEFRHHAREFKPDGFDWLSPDNPIGYVRLFTGERWTKKQVEQALRYEGAVKCSQHHIYAKVKHHKGLIKLYCPRGNHILIGGICEICNQRTQFQYFHTYIHHGVCLDALKTRYSKSDIHTQKLRPRYFKSMCKACERAIDFESSTVLNHDCTDMLNCTCENESEVIGTSTIPSKRQWMDVN